MFLGIPVVPVSRNYRKYHKMLRATCNCHKMLSNLWIWICVDMCGCVAWGPLEPSRTQHCQLRLSRQLMELASNTQALESNTLLGVLAPWGKDVGFRHAQFREASPDIGWWGNHQAENYTWAWYFFIILTNQRRQWRVNRILQHWVIRVFSGLHFATSGCIDRRQEIKAKGHKIWSLHIFPWLYLKVMAALVHFPTLPL